MTTVRKNIILHLAFCLTLGLWLLIASIRCNILEALKYSEIVQALPLVVKVMVGCLALMLMSLVPILISMATFPKSKGYGRALFCWLCLAQGVAQSLEWIVASIKWNNAGTIELSLLSHAWMFVALGLILVAALLLAYTTVGIPLVGMLLCFPQQAECIEERLRLSLKESRENNCHSSYFGIVREHMCLNGSFVENMMILLMALPYLAYDYYYVERS